MRNFALFGDCSTVTLLTAYICTNCNKQKKKTFNLTSLESCAKSLGLIAEKCSVLNATHHVQSENNKGTTLKFRCSINLFVFVYFTEKKSKSPYTSRYNCAVALLCPTLLSKAAPILNRMKNFGLSFPYEVLR